MPFELDQQLIADFVDTEVTPLQALWARVHAQAAELDPLAAAYDSEIRKLNPRHQNGFMAVSTKICWCTSLKHPARGIRSGRVFMCPPLLAAQLIVGGTHRLSTPEEIESWQKEQDQRKAVTAEQAAIRTPPPPIPVHHIHLDAGTIAAIRDAPSKVAAEPISAQAMRNHGQKPSLATSLATD